MNVNRERQEVAKRKQSQLASSSLLGILPAAAAASSSHSSASTSPDRPASPSSRFMQQQQQQVQQGVAPSSTGSRPSSAQAYVEAGQAWATSAQNGSSSGSSPLHQQLGDSKVGSTAAGAAGAAAKPGSLAAHANANLGSTAAKTAYQAYEERAVGTGTKKAGPGALLPAWKDDE
jgi:hypothetical protein